LRTFSGGNGTIVTVNGGAFLSAYSNALGGYQPTGGSARMGFGGSSGNGSINTFNLQSGLVDLASAAGANTLGQTTATYSPTVLFNQTGGWFQSGVTTSNLSTASRDFSLNGVAGSISQTAFTLSGGTANFNGTLSTTGSSNATAGGITNFNFLGGNLTANAITATNFGYSTSATATSNQVANSTNIGTLTNVGGTLAPGGNILSWTTNSTGDVTVTATATSGRTSIIGNYTQLANGTLAINIGGTTASTAFQDAAGSGKFSNLTINGSASLNGTLSAYLLSNNGTLFVPSSANSFQILTLTNGGNLTGSFLNSRTNVLTGDPFSGTLAISIATGTNGTVTLNNYSPNQWAGTSATWGTSNASWTSSIDPNASGAGAWFGANGTANATVTLGANRTVGQVVFNTANYSLDGGGYSLTLTNNGSSGSVTVQDATTQTISAAVALGNDVSFTTSNASGILQISGEVTGNQIVTVTGNGTTILSGNNSYTATSVASGATLRIGANGTSGTLGSGSVTNNGSLFFQRSDNVTVGNLLAGTGNFVQNSTGILTLSANNTYTGATTINSGTLEVTGRLGGGNYSGNITNNSAFLYSGSSAQTLNGTISGTGALTQNGSGVLTLSGNNTYSGNTTINAGTALQISGRLGGGNYSGSIANSGNLTYSGSSTQTLNGTISGTGALTLNGSGAVTLSGNNTYSGGTTVNNGATLSIGGNSTNSGSTITSGVTGTGNVSLIGNVSINNTASTNTWYANTVSVNGTVNLISTNRMATTIKTLELNNGTGVFNVNGRNMVVSGNQLFTPGANSTNSETTGSGQWEMTGTTTLGTPVIQNGVWDLETTTFTGSNYGVMRLINAMNFINADVIIGQNVLLMAANTNTLGSNASTSPNVTVNGILNLAASMGSGRTVNVKSLSGNGSVYASMLTSNTNNITLNILGTSGATTFNGTISDGAGTGKLFLTKSAGSTQILTGNNTYTGNTTITGGVLQLGNGGTTGSLSANSVITNNGSLVFNRSNTVTQGTDFSTAGISGTGSLTQNGSGTLILNAANTYTGDTTINAGTLALGSNGSIASSSVLTIASGAIFDVRAKSSGFTLNNPLTIEVGATNPGLLDATGIALTYGGTLALKFSGNLSDGASFTLFNTGSTSGNLTALTFTGTYGSGNFTNSSGNWTYTGNGADWAFSQASGVLTINVVPEPSTWALVGLSLGTLLLWRFRRVRAVPYSGMQAALQRKEQAS